MGIAQLGEELQNLPGRVAVQVSGRLVGQYQQRFVDQRPRQGHPLALATGEPVGQVSGPVRDPEAVKQGHRLGPGAAPRCPDEQRRQLHVLHRGQLVDQVEGLEHEADAAPA